MNGEELLTLFERTRRRCHLVGTPENGVVAGLDLEGRLFTLFGGRVVNRLNPQALLEQTTRAGYLNPGGDGLWPAPEGTALGYEYATGAWRVPPGLTGARYRVTEAAENRARIEAEVDLVNASGRGIPTLFSRDIAVAAEPEGLRVTVVEAIRYLGVETLPRDTCLLAPWTLCQFDCGPGGEVVFPATSPDDVWDLYDPSGDCRTVRDGLVRTRTDGTRRYQIGIGPAVPWIRLHLPAAQLVVERRAAPLAPPLDYIDIADAPVETRPSARRTRYSVYSDANGFMEIEAAGGAPAALAPGDELAVEVTTLYR